MLCLVVCVSPGEEGVIPFSPSSPHHACGYGSLLVRHIMQQFLTWAGPEGLDKLGLLLQQISAVLERGA